MPTARPPRTRRPRPSRRDSSVGRPTKRPGEGREKLRRAVESDDIRTMDADQYRGHIKSLYDGPAGGVLRLGSMISMHEPLIGRLIRKRRFDVTRFGSILDLGSGAGQILGHLLDAIEPGTRVVATDLSDGMLRRAAKRLESDVPTYAAADMTRMPFEDGTFDCVTCGYVIEHLDDPRPGLREVHRVLRPGGRLFLTATESNYLGAVVSRLWKCRTYGRGELRDACAEVGLPWAEELWFTRLHGALRMGGIVIEAAKPE